MHGNTRNIIHNATVQELDQRTSYWLNAVDKCCGERMQVCLCAYVFVCGENSGRSCNGFLAIIWFLSD